MKHLVIKDMLDTSLGNEGLLDFFFKKAEKANTSYSTEKYADRLKRQQEVLADLMANPDQFKISNATPALKLAVDGKAPSIDNLVSLVSSSFNAMAKLGDKLKRDAISHARIAAPLIKNFEKTMVDNMDDEGEVDEAILNKAMLPIIAAKSKLQQTYYNQFGNDQHIADHWLGGNPFKMVKTKTGWLDESYDVKLPVIKMPAIDSVETALEILKALAPFVMPNSYLFLDIDGPLDDIDGIPSYEFDRPVRHLDQYMTEEQQNAIYTLYSFESNTDALHFIISNHAGIVLDNLNDYILQSVVKK